MLRVSQPRKGWNLSGATVFNAQMAAANTFQDLDLSAKVGSNAALVFLEIANTTNNDCTYAAKPKGTGSTFSKHKSNTGRPLSCGFAYFENDAPPEYAYITCVTDSNGVIQHGSSATANTFTIKLIGYIK